MILLRRVPRPAAALVLTLAVLAPGLAVALVHERLPGDDAGGAGSLPVPAVIGEDGRVPVRGGGSPPVSTVPRAPAGAAVGAVADAD